MTRRADRGAAAALGLGAVFAMLVCVLLDGTRTGLLLDDLGQLAAAATASAACAGQARRSPDGRSAWVLLALGTGSWAAGQAVWTWYEVVDGTAVPFPSLADVGFLAFPLLTSAGLLVQVSSDRAAGRARDVLDGLVIAGSLLVVSWATALGQVADEAATSRLALWLALAYPVSDVLMLTLVLLALAHGRRADRAPLLALALGLGGLAVADTAYVYLVGLGQEVTLASPAWFTGFLLIAVAARSLPRERTRLDVEPVPSWWRLSLPYVPLALALAVLTTQLVVDGVVPRTESALGLAIVAAVVTRQGLVLSDNRRLVVALRRREADLAYQAFHDPLTGLANRSLLLDRLAQRVARHERDGGGLAVVFCDLDDFKAVNDRVGHAAGDELLVLAAARLRTALRGADTVARLGGDEFAALLEPPYDDVRTVAERLVEAMAQPTPGDLPLAVSVGVAVVEPGSACPTPSALLAAADRAMYDAKAGGKGRVVVRPVTRPEAALSS